MTVVDASLFFKHLQTSKRLNETELAKDCELEEASALICEVLANQIEYADVIALNKTDLLKEADVKDVTKAVALLNPKAKVIPCSYGKVPFPFCSHTTAGSHAHLLSCVPSTGVCHPGICHRR